MHKLDTTSLRRSAALLAIISGLITGAVLGSSQVALGDTNTETANRIDPTVPALTIVAKRLSKAEQDLLARQDRYSGASAEHAGRASSGANARLETSAASNAGVVWKSASTQ